MDSFSNPTTVFVTGATGFIGTRLVDALVRKGHRVRALCRSSSNLSGLDHPQVEIVRGDILDPDSLVRGMEGCSQAYHLAAYARNWAPDRRVFFRQNVDGTKNVLEAARAAGLGRIVYTSTIVAFGPTPPGMVGTEAMPRMTPAYFTDYEESKTIAERAALACASEGHPVVLVNPTRVYGPGKLTEGNSVSLMIDQYDRGRMPVLLNRGLNIGNYAFVDDLVKGHMLAMERGKVGERYILGGENALLRRIFELVDEVSGRRHFQFNLAPPFARLYARLERTKAIWFGIYARITPGWIETFLQDWAYSCAKAERELGYTITPLREGIRITYQWILAQRKSRK